MKENFSTLRLWKEPLIATAIFVITQATAGLALAWCRRLLTDSPLTNSTSISSPMPADWLAYATLVSGIISVGLLSWKGLIQWDTAFSTGNINAGNTAYSLVGALTGILAANYAVELADAPDAMRNTFTAMSASTFSLLTLALFGPIIEELVFREAVQGSMLRNGAKPWMSIIGSALIFGAIHFNWAQTMAGACIGILLAIVYYKTGSIALTSIIHVINNSISVAQMAWYSDGTEMPSTADMLGGATIATAAAIACMATSIWCMTRLWRQKSGND